MKYKRLFDPPETLRLPAPSSAGAELGDLQDGAVYVFDESIVLAVNVALAAQRPLLVTGDPGSGKSTLAACVAAHMEWRYEPETITPSTRAADLQWKFDALRRLRDAQANKLRPDEEYVSPGVLWRAFRGPDSRRAVVLLDEIDKADPDVPNSLLEALGSLSFRVQETGDKVSADRNSAPFVLLTTNDERQLPRPFVRRCIALTLPEPGDTRLKSIATAHGFDDDDDGLVSATVELVLNLRQQAKSEGRRPASTAELLDTLRACRKLRVGPNTPEWNAIATVALAKADDDGKRQEE